MIPEVELNKVKIGNIGVQIGGRIRPSSLRNIDIPDNNIWVTQPPSVIPPTVPVTVDLGTPIVNIPGCVKNLCFAVRAPSRYPQPCIPKDTAAF